MSEQNEKINKKNYDKSEIFAASEFLQNDFTVDLSEIRDLINYQSKQLYARIKLISDNSDANFIKLFNKLNKYHKILLFHIYLALLFCSLMLLSQIDFSISSGIISFFSS